MTILVTGGAGYIGSHTVKLLRSLGRDVVAFDSLERGNRASLLGAPLVVGEIADEDLIERTCRDHGVTDIVHFAAYKSAGESMQRPGMYWRNNVQGTVHLLEGALRAGVTRLVFSSSAAVYGNPVHVPVDETAPLRPENVYAETKVVMERVISWYGTTHGLRWASLRYFNAAGAADDGTIGEDWSITTNLVPLVMKAALGASGPVLVFGNDYPTADGTGVRDYIHVEDLATAHVAAIDHLMAGHGSINVNLGTGHGSSVLEVLAATERASGTPVPYEIVARRPGDPAMVYADSTLAERVLRWKASRSLEEIVTSAYLWHSKR
ncbi:MAG: UDP-glucose 4-epimerase GalE [Actinobacteria bacterium]|nr:UDP-glucose 4-epimerase GalE [Actinomycetota bacterium]